MWSFLFTQLISFWVIACVFGYHFSLEIQKSAHDMQILRSEFRRNSAMLSLFILLALVAIGIAATQHSNIYLFHRNHRQTNRNRTQRPVSAPFSCGQQTTSKGLRKHINPDRFNHKQGSIRSVFLKDIVRYHRYSLWQTTSWSLSLQLGQRPSIRIVPIKQNFKCIYKICSLPGPQLLRNMGAFYVNRSSISMAGKASQGIRGI